ncbi:hypothetical protein BDZ45DRAFT_806954 [Acephala macrosclerotiorum]|nr:hypothetical protein BDZ45DRAFT_806954 [Acephala macrosclerotiorum]
MESVEYEPRSAPDNDLAADPNRLQSGDSTNLDALDYGLDTMSTKSRSSWKPFSARDEEKLEAAFKENKRRLPRVVKSRLARELDCTMSGIESWFARRRKEEAEDNSSRRTDSLNRPFLDTSFGGLAADRNEGMRCGFLDGEQMALIDELQHNQLHAAFVAVKEGTVEVKYKGHHFLNSITIGDTTWISGTPYSTETINATILIEDVKFEAYKSGLAEPLGFPVDNGTRNCIGYWRKRVPYWANAKG